MSVCTIRQSCWCFDDTVAISVDIPAPWSFTYLFKIMFCPSKFICLSSWNQFVVIPGFGFISLVFQNLDCIHFKGVSRPSGHVMAPKPRPAPRPRALSICTKFRADQSTAHPKPRPIHPVQWVVVFKSVLHHPFRHHPDQSFLYSLRILSRMEHWKNFSWYQHLTHLCHTKAGFLQQKFDLSRRHQITNIKNKQIVCFNCFVIWPNSRPSVSGETPFSFVETIWTFDDEEISFCLWAIFNLVAIRWWDLFERHRAFPHRRLLDRHG